MVVSIGNIVIGDRQPLVLFAGPCVVEGRDFILKTAEAIRSIAVRHGVPLVFKSSYKKANRTSLGSFTGLGMDEALAMLLEVKRELGLPIITDFPSMYRAGVIITPLSIISWMLSTLITSA